MYGDRKHLLILCPFAHPNLGGVETHIDKLISYAGRNGYFSTLLTYQPLTRALSAPKYEKHEDHEILRFQWFGVGLFPIIERFFPVVFLYLFPGLFIGTFLFYVKNHKNVDVIHAHGLVAALIARIITWFYPKKTVVSTHAVYNFESRHVLSFLVHLILKDFNKILAVSDISRNELIKMGLKQERILVHPNWIDTNVFKPLVPESINSEIRLVEKFNLLFVGRFLEKKGVKLLLEAAPMLSDVGFHMVGTGPEAFAVEDAAKKLSNIHYYGVLMQTDKGQLSKLLTLYSLCHYFVSPYLYDEGFSATLIESVSCGLPVIITNRGSPPTFLNSDVAVFLSENPTYIELVEVINKMRIQESLPKRTELKQLCRDFAVNNFGFKNADVILKSYED